MPFEVAIVGAGIAGLSAAYELHRRGVRFVVLEGGNRPGGVILTEQIDGFTIDAGPDALLTHKPAAIELCRELGLGDRIVPAREPRTSYILRNGRLHPLPEASILGIPTRLISFARSTLFSPIGKARMAMELLLPRGDGRAGDESIASFIGRRFGAEAVRYLAEPLLAGIHAGDVDRLSMRALFPRLMEAEARYGSVIRAFRSGAEAPPAGGVFRSLTGGIGEMVDALVKTLPPGSIRCGSSVKAIQGTSPFILQTISGETVASRGLIVAAPSYAAARILLNVDEKLSSLCAGIAYASSATIVLAWPRSSVAHPLGGSGFVVPRVEGLTTLAATWVSSKWPDRAPPHAVLLRAFAGGARDPDALQRSDAELIASVEKELRSLLGIRGDRLLARIYRWERANAQHEVGHLERIEAIDRALPRSPGLYLTGSGFRGVGIPDCVADARATAIKAAEWVKDHRG